MNRIPFSLGALHAFEAAARLGSFKAAATELALSPTAVSHRIRTLEAQLGKPLFERRTRAVVLTADGRLLAEAVSGSFAAIAEAAARIRRPERSRVILALTPEFARQWLVPRRPQPAAARCACGSRLAVGTKRRKRHSSSLKTAAGRFRLPAAALSL